MGVSTAINAGRTFVFITCDTAGIGAIKLHDGECIAVFDGKRPAEIRAAFPDFAAGHPIVSHNLSSDRGFLTAAGLNLPNRFLDIGELACLLYPTIGDYGLPLLLRKFNCEDTVRLWAALFDGLRGSDLPIIQEINRLMEPTAWEYREIFAELERILDNPEVFPDEQTAAPETHRFREEKEPYDPANKVALDMAEVLSVFDRRGIMSAGLPHYEDRPEQRAMAETVGRAFNEDRHLFIEAGTGVGKSLAYLVPAVFWAVRNRLRVVISTNTRNLQDQLWTKEIPFLKKHLPIPFHAALVKGRENYICLNKWVRLYEEPLPVLPDERRILAYLLAWRHKTVDGLLENVSAWYIGKIPALRDLVDQIRAEEETCLKRFCPFKKECFYQRIKTAAHGADIIISNHALTLAPPKWFPLFGHLILDEAHNVEDAATEIFTREASLVRTKRVLSWLYGGSGGRSRLYFVWSALRREKVSGRTERMQQLRREISVQLEVIGKTALPEFSDIFLGLVETASLPLDELKAKDGWANLRTAWENLIVSLQEMKRLLEELEEQLEDVLPVTIRKREAAGTVRALVHSVGELAADFNFILREKSKDYVYWAGLAHRRDGTPVWFLKAAPINVGEFLQPLYEEKSSIVFTSATLTTAGDFSFFLDRLGCRNLPEGRVATTLLGSPFNYKERVVLAIPADFPPFQHREPGDFLNAVSEGICTAAASTRGKILVLFNSVARMRALHEGLKARLEKENILVLCQYVDGPRKQLAEKMVSLPGSVVLLGAKSFQEGIDISGLDGVILEKIPFPNPNDPVIRGRSRFLEQSGRNPWDEYLFPLATISLRQCFGRLIRKKTDRGFVIIFDSRLLRSFRLMKRSLPACREIVQPLERFYDFLKGHRLP